MLKQQILKTGKRLLPAQSRRRIWVKHFLLQTGLFTRFVEDLYQHWIKTVEPKLVSQLTKHAYQPLISIVVPAWNTPDKYLQPLIESVMGQTYPKWELCVADGSSDPDRQGAIEQICTKDKRIKYQKLAKNGGISANTNAALAMTSGEFVAFLDHDDVLAPFALNEIATVLQSQRDLDLIYSDEDLCNDSGKRRFNPFFKPDWSPDLLWCLNYITHFVVARRSLVEKIGRLRPEFDGAQDYDFLLRLTEQTDKIYHVPKMLYHWRMAEGSTAKGGIQVKGPALEAGRRALEEALTRRKLEGIVEVDDARNGNYRTDFRYKEEPKVALAIAHPYDLQKTGLYLTKLMEITDYQNLEIYLPEIPSNLPNSIRATKVDAKNYWQNIAELKVDIVLGIQATYLPLNKNWLTKLVGTLQQEHVGAVTGMTIDNNQNVYDYGMFKDGGKYWAAFQGIKHTAPTLAGFINWPRNFSGLSGGLFAIKAEKLRDNLQHRFVVDGRISPEFFNELYKKGYKNLGWPYVKLQKSRFVLRTTDPLFNPNLAIEEKQVNLGDF